MWRGAWNPSENVQPSRSGVSSGIGNAELSAAGGDLDSALLGCHLMKAGMAH